MDIYSAMVTKLLKADALTNLIFYSQFISMIPEKVSSDDSIGSWSNFDICLCSPVLEIKTEEGILSELLAKCLVQAVLDNTVEGGDKRPAEKPRAATHKS
ncbi:hypothetical protein BTVI_112865 [Pitangus sulphuratus]|nr:hypothetical protein BTVI_112865 [Pitangus sulphuratus]